MGGSEMRAFVFVTIYIIVFATILQSMPAGFQGQEANVNTVIPVDPSLISGFAESENYCGDNFTSGTYEYTLNSKDWIASYSASAFELIKKIYVFGVLWLGGFDQCKFTSPDGVDRDVTLSLTEIDADAEDGQVRYSMQFVLSGESAGSFVLYWNTTAYATAALAHASNELYIIHGIGIEDLATNNILSLIVAILLFQIPDVPVLVNLFLAVPPWACIIYLLYFFITSVIPFIGGS